MSVVAEEEVAVPSDILAQHLDGFIHRNQASVCVLSRENGFCRWVVLAEHPPSRDGFDPVAADHRIVSCFRPVCKHAHDVSRPIVDGLHIDQLLAKARDALGHDLDELIKEVCAVDAAAVAVGVEFDFVDGVTDLLAWPDISLGVGPAGVADADGEPAVCFAGGLIGRLALVEGVEDGGGDFLHGGDGIGAEGYTGAYLSNCERSNTVAGRESGWSVQCGAAS